MATRAQSAAAQKKDDAAPRKAPGGKFAKYQERATGEPKEPLVYGEEEGFDPPIVIPVPNADRVDLVNRVQLDKDKLRILVNDPDNFTRLWAVVGQWDMDPFGAFVKDVFRYYFGPGATDVPGGSTRS